MYLWADLELTSNLCYNDFVLPARESENFPLKDSDILRSQRDEGHNAELKSSSWDAIRIQVSRIGKKKQLHQRRIPKNKNHACPLAAHL
jgi:hypothetical protein